MWYWSEKPETRRSLTALLLRVALLDVLAGFGGVRLAAVRTAEVLQVSPEGLEGGVDPGVPTQEGLVPVGKSFVFVDLWKWISSHAVIEELHGFWHLTVSVVIVRQSKEVLCPGVGRSRGARRTRWSWFTLWTL